MPPLTLEQILARSMRLSRKRVPEQISNLFKQPSERVEKGINVSQTLFGKSPASTRFDQIVKKETNEMSHYMSIHSSKGLVKNNVDLLNILRSNAKLGTWEDAVAAFVHNTGCEFTSLGAVNGNHNSYNVNFINVNENDNNDNNDDNDDHNSSNATKRNTTSGVIQPTVEHVNVLMNICVKAGQWNLVQDITSKFAEQFPEILVRVANALIKRAHYANDSAYSSLQKEYESCSDNDMWHKESAMLSLWFILQKCNVPCHCIPVDVYNVCLKLCENEHNWLGALRIVRSMGANPLQKVNLCPEEDAKEEVMWETLLSRECEKHDKENTNDEKEADENDHHYHSDNNNNNNNRENNNSNDNDVDNEDELAHLPVPNVVSYAILIATLEEAGRNDLARKVLAILPPLEREEITASYAALIYVWASQAANAHNNHHRRSRKY